MARLHHGFYCLLEINNEYIFRVNFLLDLQIPKHNNMGEQDFHILSFFLSFVARSHHKIPSPVVDFPSMAPLSVTCTPS